jgi:glucose-1-phosphate thymidylyltransferase
VLVKAVVVVGYGSAGGGPVRGVGWCAALERVANRPIVNHVLDGLRAGGVGEFVVAGEADALIDVRECLECQGPAAEQAGYVVCAPAAGLGETLGSVASAVGDAPCVLQPADGLLGEPVGPLVALLGDGSPDLVLLISPQTADTYVQGRRKLLAGMRLDSGSGHTAPNGHPIADVGVFGPGALKRASEILDPGQEADLAVIADRVAADGGKVVFHVVEGWHRYRGDAADLLGLNRVALDDLVASVPPSARSENQIEGRVHIDPGAEVRSSVIIGPSVIGAGARVVDAYIGPYTSIGAGARIEGAEVERSIISPGASVMHVGGRLVSSLVGRDARVFRDFSLPRAMRLWVGDGDEVALF